MKQGCNAQHDSFPRLFGAGLCFAWVFPMCLFQRPIQLGFVVFCVLLLLDFIEKIKVIVIERVDHNVLDLHHALVNIHRA